MSFLTAIPQELASAAAQLEAIASALEAQVAGAAAPTVTIAPAASDAVSLVQSGVFGSYGTLFQQLAAEANTVQQQFASTLGLSSGTYGTAEATNAAIAEVPGDSLIATISTLLGGPVTSFGGPTSLSSNIGNIFNIGGGNYASACSALLGLAGGGLLPTDAAEAAVGDVAGASLASDTVPAAGGAGMAPVGAMGGATMVGNKLSVPPGWASAAPAVTSPATAIRTVGLTGAPSAGTGGIIPGMPGMGGAGRNSGGFGAPRYGVKPLVMPKLQTV